MRAKSAGFVAALCGVLSALLWVAFSQLYAESILGFFDPSPAVINTGKLGSGSVLYGAYFRRGSLLEARV